MPTFCEWPPARWDERWAPGQPCRMADLDFHLPRAMHMAREAGLARIRPALRHRGVTEAQWRLMRVLEAEGVPLTATELARRAGGTETNARLVARWLVARRFAAWQDDPGPGRVANDWRAGPWLTLASGGDAMIWRLRRAMRHNWADTADVFPPAARRALGQALDRLAVAAGADPAPDLARPTVHPERDDPPGWGPEGAHELDLGLPLALRRTRAALLKPLRAELRRYDMTEPQWRILRILETFGFPLTQRGIIRAGCFLGAEARHALDMLLERGLVQWDLRRRKTANGRPRKRYQLELSRAGADMIARVEMQWARRAPGLRGAVTAGQAERARGLALACAAAWMGQKTDADGIVAGGHAHPLAAVYAEQEAAGRAWHAQRREAAEARHAERLDCPGGAGQ